MNNPKTGLVALASRFESGGQRSDELVSSISKALTGKGITVVNASRVVWDAADAIQVCNELKKAGIGSLILIDVTWVTDSLKYIFINEFKVPVLFWAVPYTETFSIGCVQHFGAILKNQGIPYQYVYGLTESGEAVEKAVQVARLGQVINSVKGMRLALIGPRQTWRVAGPQDMTNEEWEFSRKFGVTILHIEMDEVLDAAEKISDTDAEDALKNLASRTGNSLADKAAMLRMAKVYLSTKNLIKNYCLDAIAAECYPQFGGQMNLPSSWLADEGFVVDTEGDISHAVLMYVLNKFAGGGATALGEVGSFKDDILSIAHEGSTAHSLAADISKVQISPSGESGAFVGLPLKPMDPVTVTSFAGSAGKYKMLISLGNTLEATKEEWTTGGSKLLVKLRIGGDAGKTVNAMMEAGLDHHLLIKEGDYTSLLELFCDYLGIEKAYV
jgi:L-fucose isomerase-like protein